MNIGDEILPTEIPRDTTYQDMDIQPQASSIYSRCISPPATLSKLCIYVSYYLECSLVGREYSTDACNNIAIEFISIPLERTDGIEMSFCGSLMMKDVLTISMGIGKINLKQC